MKERQRFVSQAANTYEDVGDSVIGPNVVHQCVRVITFYGRAVCGASGLLYSEVDVSKVDGSNLGSKTSIAYYV